MISVSVASFPAGRTRRRRPDSPHPAQPLGAPPITAVMRYLAVRRSRTDQRHGPGVLGQLQIDLLFVVKG